MSDISEAAASNKQAIKQITLLMPVWGYQFIGRFLEFCLPTLLAPNNIPAIARTKPCRFILLSSAADEPVIRKFFVDMIGQFSELIRKERGK